MKITAHEVGTDATPLECVASLKHVGRRLHPEGHCNCPKDPQIELLAKVAAAASTTPELVSRGQGIHVLPGPYVICQETWTARDMYIYIAVYNGVPFVGVFRQKHIYVLRALRSLHTYTF